MSKRKPYNDRPGYIASKRSGSNGGSIVIYYSQEQGLDIDAGKYAVICELHHTIYQTTSIALARTAMKSPDFCEICTDYDKRKNYYTNKKI